MLPWYFGNFLIMINPKLDIFKKLLWQDLQRCTRNVGMVSIVFHHDFDHDMSANYEFMAWTRSFGCINGKVLAVLHLNDLRRKLKPYNLVTFFLVLKCNFPLCQVCVRVSYKEQYINETLRVIERAKAKGLRPTLLLF